MELLSQIGISPKLPHPLGRVPRAEEAAGAEVPDAAMHSLRGCGDWAPSWPVDNAQGLALESGQRYGIELM